jgi:hypothetical protein
MNQRVLSGTAILVPSGIGSSCYRGPESSLGPCFPAFCSRRNQKSLGFLLTGAANRVGHDQQQRLTSRADVHNPGSSPHLSLGECGTHDPYLQNRAVSA